MARFAIRTRERPTNGRFGNSCVTAIAGQGASRRSRPWMWVATWTGSATRRQPRNSLGRATTLLRCVGDQACRGPQSGRLGSRQSDSKSSKARRQRSRSNRLAMLLRSIDVPRRGTARSSDHRHPDLHRGTSGRRCESALSRLLRSRRSVLPPVPRERRQVAGDPRPPRSQADDSSLPNGGRTQCMRQSFAAVSNHPSSN